MCDNVATAPWTIESPFLLSFIKAHQAILLWALYTLAFNNALTKATNRAIYFAKKLN